MSCVSWRFFFLLFRNEFLEQNIYIRWVFFSGQFQIAPAAKKLWGVEDGPKQDESKGIFLGNQWREPPWSSAPVSGKHLTFFLSPTQSPWAIILVRDLIIST